MADVLIEAKLPAGPLRPEDMSRIDLEVPFEISDGKLEIMTPPSIWHRSATRRIERLLEAHYPYATGDVPVTVGESGRRPDVVAVLQTEDELLRQRAKAFTPTWSRSRWRSSLMTMTSGSTRSQSIAIVK